MAKNPTPAQRAAIETRDRTLLVAAAAGSGKTWTLTERILASLLDAEHPVELDELLIVTFTTAAAAELRERIGAALRAALREHPGSPRLERQLLTLPTARIQTIDAFCNDVVHQNAEAVGLPPTYRVPDVTEAHLLAMSVMDRVIDGLFDGAFDEVRADDFAALAACLCQVRSDEQIGEVLLSLYRRTETQAEGYRSLYPLVEALRLSDGETPDGHPTVRLLIDKVHELVAATAPEVQDALSAFTGQARTDTVYRELLGSLAELLLSLREATTYGAVARRLAEHTFPHLPTVRGKDEAMLRADRVYGAARKELERMRGRFFSYTEAQLRTLFAELSSKLTILVDTIGVFDAAFRAEKRRLGLCEYADMERYAYECLWQNGRRTPYAEALREQLAAVYIDEYQDVNRLQDAIFSAVCREDNAFMVGDIKQSIYGFRSADPSVFAELKTTLPLLSSAADAPRAALYMSENFRCDRGVIATVNAVFDALFGALGESIGYRPEDRLTFAKAAPTADARAEAILIETSAAPEGEEADEVAVLRDVEAEGYAIARRIEAMLDGERKSDGSPIEPSDIAILLRSAKSTLPVLSEILRAHGIPCAVSDPVDFFYNAEVLLALCLLNAIDNPARDVYLAGLLLSPLFSFTADDLVRFRSAGRGTLYQAMRQYAETTGDERARAFLDTLGHFRHLAEGLPMDELLLRLYRDTGLLALSTRHGGRDNLLLLYEYARSFERSSYRGLFAFISYINRLIETGTSFDARAEGGESAGAVRLMSVHASKGLEFPVVFVAGCGRRISCRDTADRLLYARDFGIALRLLDPTGLSFVDNPVRAAIAEHMTDTAFDEELRILYVALTRARERLIVTGTVGPRADELLEAARTAGARLSPYTVRRMRSFMELVLATAADTMHLSVVPTSELGARTADPSAPTADEPRAADPALVRLLTERFHAAYPYEAQTTLPEKLSVSVLSPAVLDGNEEEVRLLIDPITPQTQSEEEAELPAFFTGKQRDTGALRGTATHAFLQFCDLNRLAETGAAEELSRLTDGRFLSEEEAKLVRLTEIEAFARSPLLGELCRARRLYRELRFHVQLPAADFTEDVERRAALGDTRLLVQGVIDCLLEDEDGQLHLIDYKTDRLSPAGRADRAVAEAQLVDRHRRQLTYYAAAVRQMFGREVASVRLFSLALGDTVDVL